MNGKQIIYFILLLFVAVGCSDPASIPHHLSVTKKFLPFSSAGDTQTFEIQSNGEWSISAEENNWCTINETSGFGNKEITVEIAENTTTLFRTLNLTISSTHETIIVGISQDGLQVQEIPKHYLPLVTITTENNNPIDSKDYYLNAVIKIETRNEDGEITDTVLEADTEIKGRGNSTWRMDKKPYRIKLNKSSKVLGMPKSKHWVLLANHADKTLFRNELAFEISRRMGFAYTPRSQHVDVILNGEYAGNYMLCEHVRIDENRVNVAELEPGDTDITGGYLLEIDERASEPVWFKTELGDMIFCVNRPEDIPDNQKEYIQNHIQKLENTLYGKDGINTASELTDYLDLRSYIDYFLVNEISKNVDGNLRLSTFLYKDRQNDIIYFGPVWDYDIAFGNTNEGDCDLTTGWYARNAAWYQEFFSHDTFSEMVRNRWKELRAGELSDLISFIDELSQKLQQSQEKNYLHWDILDKEIWPNQVVTGSYNGEVSYLKYWLTERIAWLDSQFN